MLRADFLRIPALLALGPPAQPEPEPDPEPAPELIIEPQAAVETVDRDDAGGAEQLGLF